MLIEAGEQIVAVVPAEHANVVRVITVHRCGERPRISGGLCAWRAGGHVSASPAWQLIRAAGVVHGAPVSDSQEERYLLYVAMTRARDQLVLSRAVLRGDKAVKRSLLLPEGLDGAEAPRPVRSYATMPAAPECARNCD